MEGGIRAWKGLVAKGAPETGIAYFPPESLPSELTALAWLLEDGTKKFYSGLVSELKNSDAAGLFQDLADVEQRHKEALYQIYLGLSGGGEDPRFPESVFPGSAPADYMEGGVDVRKALEWTRRKSPQEIVEFALSLEVNSYDVYLKMEQRIKDPRAGKMFNFLAEEEKGHLNRLQELFIRLMTPA
jgi:rubrerythrin